MNFKHIIIGSYIAGVVIATCTIPFLVSQYRPVFYGPRTMILVLPMACVFVAYLVTRPTAFLAVLIAMGISVGVILSSAQLSVRTMLSAEPYSVRSSIKTILAQATCNDTFVLGGLSYSEVEYYLRLNNVPSDCFHRETYPISTSSHAGWIDIPGLLANRGQLEDEAIAQVQKYSRLSDSRVWLYNSRPAQVGVEKSANVPFVYGDQVTQIIKKQLDHQMIPIRVLDLRGSWFSSVVLYAKK
jgi:hypothetical protein